MRKQSQTQRDPERAALGLEERARWGCSAGRVRSGAHHHLLARISPCRRASSVLRRQRVGDLADSDGTGPNARFRNRPEQDNCGAPGWNRTSDTRFRKPVLYPLSYEGIMPFCRDFPLLRLGKNTTSCQEVARSAGNRRAHHSPRPERQPQPPPFGQSWRPSQQITSSDPSLTRQDFGPGTAFSAEVSEPQQATVGILQVTTKAAISARLPRGDLRAAMALVLRFGLGPAPLHTSRRWRPSRISSRPKSKAAASS